MKIFYDILPGLSKDSLKGIAEEENKRTTEADHQRVLSGNFKPRYNAIQICEQHPSLISRFFRFLNSLFSKDPGELIPWNSIKR